MNIVYLLLGANLGNPRDTFRLAKKVLEEKAGRIIKESALYSTAAWGLKEQPDFLNQVILLNTQLTPTQLLECCLDVEKELGRERSTKNAARIIDIDILFYNSAIIDLENLQIPHPEIPNRRFVLVPLRELSPGFIHPVKKMTIAELLTHTTDLLAVKRI